MVQPSSNQPKDIKIEQKSDWKPQTVDSLPNLHNIENFSLSDLNEIKKVVSFIMNKGNLLDDKAKRAVATKLENQIKQIKRDTTGVLAWFKYLFRGRLKEEKLLVAAWSKELKKLVLNENVSPRSLPSERQENPQNSLPPSQNISSGQSLLPKPPESAEGSSEDSQSGPTAPPPVVFAQPPPPPAGNAPPPPPPPGAPKPKAPEKLFLGEPKEPAFDPKGTAKTKKEELPAQIEQIERYLEEKKNALGILPPSKGSPKGSPRSRSPDLVAASKKFSDAGEKTFATELGEVDAFLATPAKGKNPAKNATPAKATPVKAPAKVKTEDAIKEIRIALLTLFEKDPDLVSEKIKTGSIAEKVTLITLLEEKLKDLEEVRKERSHSLNSAKAKVDAFSQKGDLYKQIQVGQKGSDPIIETVCFFERDEDFFRENEKRKSEGKSPLTDAFRKAIMLEFLEKELARDRDDHHAVMAQIGQIEELLKKLAQEKNNDIPFNSEAPKIFKIKVDTVKAWEKALLDRKRKLEEKAPQIQQAAAVVAKPVEKKVGFDRLNDFQEFKIAQRSPAGVIQMLNFEEIK